MLNFYVIYSVQSSILLIEITLKPKALRFIMINKKVNKITVINAKTLH